MTATSIIAEPLQLPCGATLPNRLVKSALTEGLGDAWNRATHSHVNLYRSWSMGGVGLLITGNIQVDRRYLERPGNVAIDGPQDEAQLAAFRAFAQAAKSGGSMCWVQLGHAGRQSNTLVNLAAVGPSAVKWNHPTLGRVAPRALAVEEVEDVQRRFVDAAKVCQDVGFDGVQLHCAHGYLLSSFLSPLANTRQDKYGGSVENRARLVLDVVKAVRAAVRPDFAVAVKINSADFQKGGFMPEECAQVVAWLDDLGVDLIEVSGGNYENGAMVVGETVVSRFTNTKNQSTIRREAYFLQFVPEIRMNVKRAKVMVTGGMRSKRVMEDAIESGNCDLIGIGRPLCGEPDCTRKLLDGRILALPSFEDDLKLPVVMRPLLLTRLGPILTMYFQVMWFFYQERLLGAGRLVDNAIGSFGALMATLRIEDAQATSLQGLDCVGEALNAKSKLAERSFKCMAVATGICAVVVGYRQLWAI